MTFSDCIGPGPTSLHALAWLARVGAAPLEPLALVIGCSERVAHDHVRRLAAAGLVGRVAMRRGDGSLIVLTRQGAVEAGYAPGRALRSLAPTTWAHSSACAWVSAWLELRGHMWWSEREIAQDSFWRREVRYQDRRGTVGVTHRPDLGVRVAGRPAAIEVELQRKVRARLVGILRMYAHASAGEDAAFGGVLYVTSREDVADAVRRAAADGGLRAPALSFRTLQEVIAQARHAAAQRMAASGFEPIGDAQ